VWRLLDSHSILCLFSKKLLLVGVGYKASPMILFDNQLLEFKLGYTHHIYFKISTNLNVYSYKTTTIFISGDSNQAVSQTAALIRSCKVPEVYKGKGILYDNEKITLKKGKKV
jgi:large subunit ribosomal protein L6